MQNGMGHVARIMMKKGRADSTCTGTFISRRVVLTAAHCFDTRVGDEMVPAAPACKTEFAGTCIQVGPEFPANTITVGAWHALHYVGTGDTPTAVSASNTPFCTALLSLVVLPAECSCNPDGNGGSDVTCGKSFTIMERTFEVGLIAHMGICDDADPRVSLIAYVKHGHLFYRPRDRGVRVWR